MELSIIIVSWNTKKLLEKAISSAFEYLKEINFEIIIVDNNSDDGTQEAIEKLINDKKCANVRLIKNNENIGFAKANNQAIKYAKSDLILLLNPDAELIDDSLLKAIKYIKEHDVDILGPKLLNTDLTLQRSCRRFPKLSDQLFIQLKFYNFIPNKIKSVNEYFMLNFDHQSIKKVDQVMGAAMLIKKKVTDDIGLFDEKYVRIFEEVDFCYRARQKGYSVIFYPEARVVHHKGESFKRVSSIKKQLHFNHCLHIFFKKHRPFWQFIVLWLIQPVNIVLTWLDSILNIKGKVGKSKDL